MQEIQEFLIAQSQTPQNPQDVMLSINAAKTIEFELNDQQQKLIMNNDDNEPTFFRKQARYFYYLYDYNLHSIIEQF